jgi:hypothetical protein
MSLLTELLALPVTVAINILPLRSRSSAPLNQWALAASVFEHQPSASDATFRACFGAGTQG